MIYYCHMDSTALIKEVLYIELCSPLIQVGLPFPLLQTLLFSLIFASLDGIYILSGHKSERNFLGENRENTQKRWKIRIVCREEGEKKQTRHHSIIIPYESKAKSTLPFVLPLLRH
jgi:hypothetical protein